MFPGGRSSQYPPGGKAHPGSYYSAMSGVSNANWFPSSAAPVQPVQYPSRTPAEPDRDVLAESYERMRKEMQSLQGSMGSKYGSGPPAPPPPSMEPKANPLTQLLENKDVSLSSLLEAAMDPTVGSNKRSEDPIMKKTILDKCEGKIAQLYRLRISGQGMFFPFSEPKKVEFDGISLMTYNHPQIEFNMEPGKSLWNCPDISVKIKKEDSKPKESEIRSAEKGASHSQSLEKDEKKTSTPFLKIEPVEPKVRSSSGASPVVIPPPNNFQQPPPMNPTLPFYSQYTAPPLLDIGPTAYSQTSLVPNPSLPFNPSFLPNSALWAEVEKEKRRKEIESEWDRLMSDKEKKDKKRKKKKRKRNSESDSLSSNDSRSRSRRSRSIHKSRSRSRPSHGRRRSRSRRSRSRERHRSSGREKRYRHRSRSLSLSLSPVDIPPKSPQSRVRMRHSPSPTLRLRRSPSPMLRLRRSPSPMSRMRMRRSPSPLSRSRMRRSPSPSMRRQIRRSLSPMSWLTKIGSGPPPHYSPPQRLREDFYPQGPPSIQPYNDGSLGYPDNYYDYGAGGRPSGPPFPGMDQYRPFPPGGPQYGPMGPGPGPGPPPWMEGPYGPPMRGPGPWMGPHPRWDGPRPPIGPHPPVQPSRLLAGPPPNKGPAIPVSEKPNLIVLTTNKGEVKPPSKPVEIVDITQDDAQSEITTKSKNDNKSEPVKDHAKVTSTIIPPGVSPDRDDPSHPTKYPNVESEFTKPLRAKFRQMLEPLEKVLDKIRLYQRDSFDFITLIRNLEAGKIEFMGVYTLHDGLLCKLEIDRNNPNKFFKIVIPTTHVKKVLVAMHEAYHDYSISKIQRFIWDLFHDPNEFSTVRIVDVFRKCKVCIKRDEKEREEVKERLSNMINDTKASDPISGDEFKDDDPMVKARRDSSNERRRRRSSDRDREDRDMKKQKTSHSRRPSDSDKERKSSRKEEEDASEKTRNKRGESVSKSSQQSGKSESTLETHSEEKSRSKRSGISSKSSQKPVRTHSSSETSLGATSEKSGNKRTESVSKGSHRSDKSERIVGPYVEVTLERSASKRAVVVSNYSTKSGKPESTSETYSKFEDLSVSKANHDLAPPGVEENRKPVTTSDRNIHDKAKRESHIEKQRKEIADKVSKRTSTGREKEGSSALNEKKDPVKAEKEDKVQKGMTSEVKNDGGSCKAQMEPASKDGSEAAKGSKKEVVPKVKKENPLVPTKKGPVSAASNDPVNDREGKAASHDKITPPTHAAPKTQSKPVVNPDDFKDRVRTVQMSVDDLNTHISNLEGLGKKSSDPSLLLKAGMLCKRLPPKGEGKPEVKIVVNSDCLKEMVEIVHTMAPLHAPFLKTVSVFKKHFVPIEGLEQAVSEVLNCCAKCSSEVKK